jgi:polysaccharide biosynthesis protein PslJ
MSLPTRVSDRIRQADAIGLLTFFTFLLLIIPAPLEFAPLGGAGSPATIFGVVLLILYLATWLHPRLAPERSSQPIRRAGICFFCSILVTYVSVNRHALSTSQLNGVDRGIIMACGWLGVLLIAADDINRIERLKALFGRIIMGVTIVASLAMVQFFTGLNAVKYVVIPGLSSQQPFTDLGTREALYRVSATATSPIELAAVLAVCLPLAVHQARFARPELRRRRWIQVALIGGALPLTLSRTAVVAFVVSCLVLLPTWPKRDRRLAYIVGGLSVIAMWAMIPGLLGAFGSLFSEVGSDPSSTSRTGAFSSAIPFIAQNPWLGRGFDTFFPQTYFFTDDQYLHSLIETGFVGLLALLALFATGWTLARAARRATVDTENRDLAQSLAAGIAASAAAFATLDAFSFPIISGLTFMLLGCTGALWRITRATAAQDYRGSILPGSPRPGL